MPSLWHEALLELFRNRPELAPELLRRALHVPLPPFTSVRIESAELVDLQPAEYHADLVVLLVDERPVLAIIIEVQLRRDAEKRRSWPLYLVGVRARFNCPACLLVIAPSASVARWCAEPIDLGHPGFTLTPLVVGPEAVPIVTEEEEARRMPELAVLSVMAHGKTERGALIVRALVPAARDLDAKRSNLYLDLTYLSVGEAASRALEALMKSGTYQYQSEFARKYYGEGERKGECEGRAISVLTFLEARGLSIPPAARERILGSQDIDELNRWVRRAAVVSAVSELFQEPTS